MTQKEIPQELKMKYDPILGTTYQLENVIEENNEQTQDNLD